MFAILHPQWYQIGNSNILHTVLNLQLSIIIYDVLKQDSFTLIYITWEIYIIKQLNKNIYIGKTQNLAVNNMKFVSEHLEVARHNKTDLTQFLSLLTISLL